MIQQRYYKLVTKLFGVLPLLLLLLTTVSCDKENAGSDGSSTFEVSELNPTIMAEGGEVFLDITSNIKWKVGKINADWLHIETTEGIGDGKLTIKCDPHESVNSRSVEFFIVNTQNGEYHKVTFTQLATDPIIKLDLNELEVGSRPRSHEVTLNTNIPAGSIRMEVVYDDNATESWILGLRIEDGIVKFQTSLNTTPQERNATITVSYENLTEAEVEVWDQLVVSQMASGNEPPSELVTFDYVKSLAMGEITENISISGNVVYTGDSPNFRKSLFIIQDVNGSAIAFEGIGDLNFSKFEKIQLLLDGAQITTFEENGTFYKLIKGIGTSSILSRQNDLSFTPPTVQMGDLSDNHLLALVTLPAVEFAIPYGAYTNFNEGYISNASAAHLLKHYPAPLIDGYGNSMYLITNREVTYRKKAVPKGSGQLTGIIVKMADSEYGNLGSYSIRHLKESDIALSTERSSGITQTLVEWEFPTTSTASFAETTASVGSSFLNPTTGSSSIVLKKDGSPGIFKGNTGDKGGVYLVEKYRGNTTVTTQTSVATSTYNATLWGTGNSWIVENISTLGINKPIVLQFEANSSTSNGPRDFAVEYSVDGGAWKQVASYQLKGQVSGTVFTDVYAGHKMFSFAMPTEIQNKSNVRIRLVNTSNVSVNGGSITNGTSRLCHLSLKYTK